MFLLSAEEKQSALSLYRALQYAASKSYKVSPAAIVRKVKEDFRNNANVDLEYFKIMDENTFKELDDWNGTTNATAFIAARIGSVRSIDNVLLKK